MTDQDSIRRNLALIIEIDSASRLIRESLELLKKWPGPNDADAFFACLAIGMEKLLKLTLGLDGRVRGTGWPSGKTMRQWGHNIDVMDEAARRIIRDNSATATNPIFVGEALDKLDTDPWIEQVISIMAHYACFGRFHNLDFLADGKIETASPSELWFELEAGAYTPELAAQAAANNQIPNEWRRTVVHGVDQAIRTWFACYRMAWVQMVFGPDGKGMSAELRLT